MRGAVKAALSLSLGTAALALSGAVLAQTTGIGSINFGSQTLSSCTLGDSGTCKILASGNGFVQRQFASGGKTYIQTQIDDAKGFKSEDFVRLGSGTASEPGISSKLDITSSSPATSGTDTFATGSQIKSGWASSNPNQTQATINLSIARTGTTNTADDFKSNFLVTTAYDKSTGVNTVSSLRVDQVAYLGSATEKQVFATMIKQAAGNSGALKFVGDAGAGTSWSTGNLIQATYVGQAVNVGTTAAPALTSFSSETASNLTASTATSVSNLVGATPVNWTSTGPAAMQEFSPAPTF